MSNSSNGPGFSWHRSQGAASMSWLDMFDDEPSTSAPGFNPFFLRSPRIGGSYRSLETFFGEEDSEILSFAEMDLKAWCKSSVINSLVLIEAVRIWKRSGNGKFPSLDDLVEAFVRDPCFCMRRLPLSEQRSIVRHFLVEFGKIPTCSETEATVEFSRFQRRMPTQEELNETLYKMDQMNRDPDNFYAKDKLYIGCPDLDKIEAEELKEEKELTCSICMDLINKGQKMFTLPPCGHNFHATAEECLDGCSVITWLEKNRTCPCCRVEIKVDNKSNQKKDEDSK